ncbi:MAG: hypothetical protein ACYDAN_01365 [Candidatus Limnocylindrales bacterium]
MFTLLGAEHRGAARAEDTLRALAGGAVTLDEAVTLARDVLGS